MRVTLCLPIHSVFHSTKLSMSRTTSIPVFVIDRKAFESRTARSNLTKPSRCLWRSIRPQQKYPRLNAIHPSPVKSYGAKKRGIKKHKNTRTRWMFQCKPRKVESQPKTTYSRIGLPVLAASLHHARHGAYTGFQVQALLDADSPESAQALPQERLRCREVGQEALAVLDL